MKKMMQVVRNFSSVQSLSSKRSESVNQQRLWTLLTTWWPHQLIWWTSREVRRVRNLELSIGYWVGFWVDVVVMSTPLLESSRLCFQSGPSQFSVTSKRLRSFNGTFQWNFPSFPVNALAYDSISRISSCDDQQILLWMELQWTSFKSTFVPEILLLDTLRRHSW